MLDLYQLQDDKLRERMGLLARGGRFREAIGVMAVLLIRRLATQGLAQLHPSKTNGDYVRELPAASSVHAGFRSFVQDFDRTIYSGAVCGREDYDRINGLAQQVCGRVI